MNLDLFAEGATSLEREASAERSAFRLITRLFVRRLVDNDLISQRADRHESLATAYGLVVSLGVFATFFLSTSYLAAFVQLPGPAALSALSDRFLFIAASITISALAALLVWDALALEARDAAILGVLPVAGSTITRAKLAAAMVFGIALTVGLNAVPSVLYPAFLTLNIRGTRGTTILMLMAAHATTTMLAGLFGFFAIVSVRGTLRLLLREQGFQRVSSGVQSFLVVGMVTALLLAPTVRARDVRRWVGDDAARWPVRPALWYLGMNEALAGHRVAETPIVFPPRYAPMTFRTQGDKLARSLYRPLLPRFTSLSRRAWLSFPLVTALALATFLWTNRRLPDRAAAAPVPSRIRRAIRQLGERFTDDDPEAQAGFFFALQTLTRSAPHRTIIAVAMAIGVTHALLVLTQMSGYPPEIRSTPPRVFAISVMLLLSMLGAICYGATVPAAPAANWTIRMAWLGDERRYLTGVKRAGVLLAAMLLIVLVPLNVALLGSAGTVAHSLLGLLFAVTALDLLFFSSRKVPFACSYVPLQNPKVAWPAGLVGMLLVTYGFANAEQRALQTPGCAFALAAALAAMALLVRMADLLRRREPQAVSFDHRPVHLTQRLGLLEHIVSED